MRNIQKAKDCLELLCLACNTEDSLTQYVCKSIYDAVRDGHTGCVVHTIPATLRISLERADFVIHEELEEDNRYYIISWGEEVIA